METYYLNTPLKDEDVKNLRIGDRVFLSGVIYTARDTAHKRLLSLLQDGQDLPLDLQGQVIYYAGPSPAKPGHPIGSIGPTTSYRMDAYAPALISEKGLKGMIGKGKRNQSVKDAISAHTAVYFGATGGAAALLCKCVKEADVILYPELGPEAVRRLVVEEFPVIVINDCHGGDLYEQSVLEWNTEAK